MINKKQIITYSKINSNHINKILDIEKELYVGGLREDRQSVVTAMQSTEINWGAFDQDTLVGFVLGLQEDVGEICLYDISVITKYQHQGIGKALYKLFLADCQKMSLSVNIYCRKTSVKLITNPTILAKYNYKIIKNLFEPDGYYELYGVHEDGYDVRIAQV